MIARLRIVLRTKSRRFTQAKNHVVKNFFFQQKQDSQEF